ncbi:hypothetical protein [Microbacterium sp.]
MGTDKKITAATPKPAPAPAPEQPNPFKMTGTPTTGQSTDASAPKD